MMRELKPSASMWRTFNGALYTHWQVCPTNEDKAGLRAAGVRCRHVRSAAREIDDLFVHIEDQELAKDANAGRRALQGETP